MGTPEVAYLQTEDAQPLTPVKPRALLILNSLMLQQVILGGSGGLSK